MASSSSMAKVACTVLLLAGSAFSSPMPNLKRRQMSPPSRNTPFGGFIGCDDKGIKAIEQGWADVVEITEAALQGQKFDQLASRFFGDDIHGRPADRELVDTVFKSIMELKNGQMDRPITIGCTDIEQTHRVEQTTCASEVSGTGGVGGYAFSYGGEHGDGTIVLCPQYFLDGQQSLKDIKADIDKAGDSSRKDAKQLAGKGRMLLHELAHLASMSKTDDIIIKDQYYGDVGVKKVYGVDWAEKYARKKGEFGRNSAQLNADSIAWFGLEKWYEKVYNGVPDASVAPRDGTDDEDENEDQPPKNALNIIFEQHMWRPDGEDRHTEWKWLFFSVPFGQSSHCVYDPIPVAEAPAEVQPSVYEIIGDYYPGGTFEVKTQEGMCKYRNNGQGNPGALWCHDDQMEIKCRDHSGRGELRWCRQSDKGGDPKDLMVQAESVVCEW